MKKIKKGDEVIVIAGKDKGKRGTVLSVVDGGGKLLVEGINMAKKHVKANPNAGDRGGIILKTMPIQRSNVMVLCQFAILKMKCLLKKIMPGPAKNRQNELCN